jgi:Kef-type K+ transport system membrane component KefB
MLHTTTRPHTVGKTTIVISLVLLFGVLSMAYGFFRSDIRWIDLGVLLTIATSFALLVQILIPHQPLNRERRTG